GIAPRIFLRKLVEGLLDRIDQFPDFDPEKHFELVVDGNQLSAEERAAAGLERTVDEVELDLSAPAS
ncbi:MAG: BREX system ATP-binding protein BrxD, partial [Bosea sp.]|nr:BREX system ATP-binding protein BrxD [Bosea sp. (in: a-proteobacteria)]MCP4663566.1 BREX system ATP-binding protein BrxD [bacterium]